MTTTVCQPGVSPQLGTLEEVPLTLPPRIAQGSGRSAVAPKDPSPVDTIGLVSYPSGIASALRELKQSQSVVGQVTAMAGQWVDAATGVFSVYEAASKEIQEGRSPGKDTLVAITAAVSKNLLSAGIGLGTTALMAPVVAAGAPALAVAAGTTALVVAGTFATGSLVDWLASKLTTRP